MSQKGTSFGRSLSENNQNKIIDDINMA